MTTNAKCPMPNAGRTGTKEWSEHSVNCCTGCSHGCLYCYARSMAQRFGRIGVRDGADWATEKPIDEKTARTSRVYSTTHQGTVMFPTCHDLTEGNWQQCVLVLERLLDAGNRVLVVSKPALWVWGLLIERLEAMGGQKELRGRVEFRFSIGATATDEGETLRAFWEPGAPPMQERLEVLHEAARRGWRCSVSAEPLLEPEQAGAVVMQALAAGAECVWVGLCNYLHVRTGWRGAELAEDARKQALDGAGFHAGAGLRAFDEQLAALEARQTPEAVRAMAAELAELAAAGRVKWKDSIANILKTAVAGSR